MMTVSRKSRKKGFVNNVKKVYFCQSSCYIICSIVSIIITFFSWTGVRIGFDRELYSVNESAGSVRLVTQVLSGQLSENIVVRLITRDNTAQGTVSITC